MRHTIVAVVATPVISGFAVAVFSMVTSLPAVLSYSRAGAAVSIVDFVASVATASLLIFLPMTLLLFLPVHLILVALKKRSPAVYAAAFMIVGTVPLIYLFRFLPLTELALQVASTLIMVALPGAVFWSIAVLWPLLKISSGRSAN